MCGIAGYFGNGNSDHLHTMRRLLKHRGPDEWGIFTDHDSRIGMVHTRLSIIDLQGGKQPLKNANGTITVIFNGEIYNHASLREALTRKGYQLACHSDGEVISHLYQEYGIAFVHKLRGMFAIALWDANLQKLFLIRDRFGIKPLYYQENHGSFIYASEVKALLGINRCNKVDYQALNWYLTFRYTPSDRTGFEGIKKLEPGCWMEISNGKARVEKYWDIANAPLDHVHTELENIERVHEGLKESIDLRLMSDVPVGAFLSGGLDSSYIVGLMSELNEHPVETFSFGIGDGWHNESNYAQLVADYAKTNHHPLSGDCNNESHLKQAIWHLDEPLGDTAIIPTYLLSKLTREYVTVSLMGEGADELLAGYDKYKVLKYGNMLAKLLPSGLSRKLSQLPLRSEKAFRLLDSMSHKQHFAESYVRLASVFHQRDIEQLATPELKEKLMATRSSSELIDTILQPVADRPLMDKLMYLDINTWLPNDVLLKADKMTMAHSLEGRVPFLDHIYAEKLFSIPDKNKLKGLTEKSILRKAMKGHVPEQILSRRKHGFTVPLDPWMKGEKNIIREILSKNNIQKRGWFNYHYVNRLLSMPSKEEYTRRKIVSLFCMELWAQTFIDGDGTSALPIRE